MVTRFKETIDIFRNVLCPIPQGSKHRFWHGFTVDKDCPIQHRLAVFESLRWEGRVPALTPTVVAPQKASLASHNQAIHVKLTLFLPVLSSLQRRQPKSLF